MGVTFCFYGCLRGKMVYFLRSRTLTLCRMRCTFEQQTPHHPLSRELPLEGKPLFPPYETAKIRCPICSHLDFQMRTQNLNLYPFAKILEARERRPFLRAPREAPEGTAGRPSSATSWGAPRSGIQKPTAQRAPKARSMSVRRRILTNLTKIKSSPPVVTS